MRTRPTLLSIFSSSLCSAGAVSGLVLSLTIMCSPAFAAPTTPTTPTAPTRSVAPAAPAVAAEETAVSAAPAPSAERSAESSAERHYSEEELAAAKEEARLKALRYADRGNRHLWIAFSIIWLVIFLFIFRTWRQSGSLEGELSAVKARLRSLEGDKQGGEG